MIYDSNTLISLICTLKNLQIPDTWKAIFIILVGKKNTAIVTLLSLTTEL